MRRQMEHSRNRMSRESFGEWMAKTTQHSSGVQPGNVFLLAKEAAALLSNRMGPKQREIMHFYDANR